MGQRSPWAGAPGHLLKRVSEEFRKGDRAVCGLLKNRMPNELQWLQAEQDGHEELAERMFASLMAEMPVIEPSGDFAGRVVKAAWRARIRRHRLARVVLAVSGPLLIAVSVWSIYALSVPAASLGARVAVALSRGLVWVLTSVSETARWWWIAGQIGTAVSDTITVPSTAVAIAGVEMIGLLAIYAFRQLIDKDSRWD